MTALQLTTAIVVGLFLAILILVLILNSRRKSSKSAATVTGTISPSKLEEEKKKTWGQVIKMWLFIIIIVIPITWGVGKVIWTATLSSMMNTFGVNSKGTPASYIWKKKPHQYGYNPSKRFGGPYDAVIKKDDDSNFCFIVYGGESDTHFYGKKKNENISGWWEQSEPRAGGTWSLKKDVGDPTLYTGICTDPYLPDGANIELRLKY